MVQPIRSNSPWMISLFKVNYNIKQADHENKIHYIQSEDYAKHVYQEVGSLQFTLEFCL